jgi:hypothetical protein
LRALPHFYAKEGTDLVESTMVYTHLVDSESDEYYTAVSKTDEEARKLIEDGFEYVCTTPEGTMLFKKRK